MNASRAWRLALLLALAVQVVVIGGLVLNPSPAVPTDGVNGLSEWLVNRGIGSWDTLPRVVELVLNVALFVPFGATLTLLVPRVSWWEWTAAAFLASSAIELLQWLLLSERQATWHDVLANTLGVAVGSLLVKGFGRVLQVAGRH